MKIALLPSWYPPHGGSFFAEQARELASQGVEVSVLAPRIEPFKKPQRWVKTFFSGVSSEAQDGVSVYRWCVPKISRSVHEMPRRTFYAAEKLFLSLCRQRGKPDLIHAHSAMWAGYAAARLSEKYRVPYVLTEHRSRFNIPGEDVQPWMAPYFSQAFRNAEKVLLVGSLLRNGIKPYWPAADAAIVLSNGVHTEKFRMATPAVDGKFHFVYVGTISHRKGIDLLIAAAQRIARETDQMLFHIVGDGPLRGNIRQQVQALGLNNVVLYGNLPHARLADVMACMHAFVLPTRYDAQGVVFLEAMSCGLPVIATEGAPPEVCPDFAGMRIPVDNVDALVAALLAMVKHYASFDRNAIRQYAVSHFDFKVVTAQLVSIYNEMLKRDRTNL